MEPKLSPQVPSVEVGGEKPQKAPVSTERNVFVGSQESKQSSAETRGTEPQGSVSDEPAVTTLPAPIVQPQIDAPQGQAPGGDANSSTPIAAGDDDLIEKEWVQKAKKIVEQTRSDPHSQEQEVSKLQADYLKKRYGKEIKIAND